MFWIGIAIIIFGICVDEGLTNVAKSIANEKEKNTKTQDNLLND